MWGKMNIDRIMAFPFLIFLVHGGIIDLNICLSIVSEVAVFFRLSYLCHLSTVEQNLTIASLPNFLCSLIISSSKHIADRNLKDLYR